MQDEARAVATPAGPTDQVARRNAELRAMRARRADARAAALERRYATAVTRMLGLDAAVSLPSPLTWYGQAAIDAWRAGDWRFRRFLNDHAPQE